MLKVKSRGSFRLFGVEEGFGCEGKEYVLYGYYLVRFGCGICRYGNIN